MSHARRLARVLAAGTIWAQRGETSRRRARQMVMRGRVVAVVAVVAGLALFGAVFGVHRALFGPCAEGSADPELSLNPQYWATHRDVTRIRLCIDGGRCQTKPVPTWRSVYPASAASAQGRAAPHSQVRVNALPMDFSALVPARVARLGSSGLPVRLRVTAYTAAGPVLSAAATLSPVVYLPENRCRIRGYQVNAELDASGRLGYYPLS